MIDMFMLRYKDSCKDRQPDSAYALVFAANDGIMKAPTQAKCKLNERELSFQQESLVNHL